MNLIDIPDKITVRLSDSDKLNLQCALREGLVPGYHPTTADAFRIALLRMVSPAQLAGSNSQVSDAKRRQPRRIHKR